MSEPPAVLRIGSDETELPMIVGHRGRARDRHLEAARADRAHHPRLRLREHRRRASRRSPSSTATRASSATAASPSSSSSIRSIAVVPRDVVPAHLRRAPHARPSSTSSASAIRKHTLLHEDVKRFFDGFPKDAHPMAIAVVGGQRAVDLLPGQRRPARPRAGAALDHPPDGEAARRSRRTRTRSRSASRSSTPTTRSTSSRTSSR